MYSTSGSLHDMKSVQSNDNVFHNRSYTKSQTEHCNTTEKNGFNSSSSESRNAMLPIQQIPVNDINGKRHSITCLWDAGSTLNFMTFKLNLLRKSFTRNEIIYYRS